MRCGISIDVKLTSNISGITGSGNYDCTFSGGNTGMMAAIHLAKYKRNPKWKHEGLFNSKPLALFMSEDVSQVLSCILHRYKY